MAIIKQQEPPRYIAPPWFDPDKHDSIFLAHKKHTARVGKLKALVERGSTAGERAAAEAALDRIEPDWRMSDVDLLGALDVNLEKIR